MELKIIKINAKKAFIKTKIPGANYVINQYVGCEHACLYCYAKFMCRWYKYGKWGEWIAVKENLPEIVKRENVKGVVCMSSVGDAYQPIENKTKLTKRILENMNKKTKLKILTKSDLVLRDIELFKEFEDIEVGLTVNDFDAKLKKEIEPFSPSNERRIETLKILNENGIKTYAFISPIIPNLIDVENLINDEQNTAWDIVKSYKGADDDGYNLFDTMITQIENAYPNEKILQHRDTMLEISVLDIQEQKDVGFYEVKFTFQTYDDVREYIWNVNIDTEEIASANNGAKKMLNIVDNYD